jgi:hypothetical protein
MAESAVKSTPDGFLRIGIFSAQRSASGEKRKKQGSIMVF